MIAEIGQFMLALSLCLAVLQGGMPLAGIWWRRPGWILAAVPLARMQFCSLLVAIVLLGILFVRNDFSVEYVALNSNSKLPLPYQISAVWGGHEGSLLLWVFILAGWTFAVTVFSQQMSVQMRARVLGVLGCISAGFLLFTLATSSPFARLPQIPAEGRDLNPLLQDFGLIIHPPMLYMGYVGFSVAFAFAIAALLAGRMDAAWARWARPWTLLAWSFLTLGIMLGSWWAYYELGWGGWWFWDPVENASFMPWLAGTALLHSLAVTEARGVFKPWTALLAILTFSLCLLGTFLVRSGVLTSVHSFANDPERGLFVLLLLSIAIISSLSLYAWRASRLIGTGRFALLSRESGILVNNVFLTVASFAVLLGTIYPLVLDALGQGKISIGPPYFNLVFVPLTVVPVALMVVGSYSRWKKDTVARTINRHAKTLAAAVLAGLALPLTAPSYSWAAALGLMLACWVLFGMLQQALERLRAGAQTRRATGGFWGMVIAHSGIAVFVAGVTLVNVYELERDVRLAIGEDHEMGGMVFSLIQLSKQEGENYTATVGVVNVTQDDELIAVLHPEKRSYFAQPDNVMTEAGISAKLTGDIYVSLGDPLGDGAWSARLQHKPFIRFIWGGAILMALGGLLAAADRRYRRRKAAGSPQSASSSAPGAHARAA